MCIVAFWRTVSRMTINCYLVALGCWDLVHIVTTFALYSLPTWIYWEIPFFGSHTLLYPTIYYLSSATRLGSIWTVIYIGKLGNILKCNFTLNFSPNLAIERFATLCYPLKFRSINSRRRVYSVLTCVAVFAFLYSVPRALEISLRRCIETSTKKWVRFYRPTFLR